MKKIELGFNKLILIFLLLSSSFIVLQSCIDNDDFEDQRSIDDRLILKYLNDNNITAEKAIEGYYYSVIKSNNSGSKVKDNDILSIYYKMDLLNGSKIDSVTKASSSGKPVKFKMMDKSLVPVGLRFGSSKMREGEKYRFFIPSNLAYANYSYENLFQRNSIFIIDSEIMKIETDSEQKEIEKDSIDSYIVDNSIANIDRILSGLYYKKNSDGEGDKPVDGEIVKIKFIAKYLNGTTTLDSTKTGSTFNFKLGNHTVIKGLEEGVKLMQKGEKALLIIPSHLAYDEGLQVFPKKVRKDLLDKKLILEKVPPFSILKFDVELVDIN
ncbi:MAG: FKBP-type peptidyl-prolyl cis-trans isomerase [Flavobacteriaceae bacterium]|nr:FKBP-type peptidyl-prolyl cis-trans isomerase [Flavobacteriaceae bacterium]